MRIYKIQHTGTDPHAVYVSDNGELHGSATPEQLAGHEVVELMPEETFGHAGFNAAMRAVQVVRHRNFQEKTAKKAKGISNKVKISE